MEADEKVRGDIDRAAELLLKAKHVVCLTGAGVSVESNIRPFRGPDGLWTEHGEPPLDGFQRFMEDPKVGWEKMIKGEEESPAGGIGELMKALFTAKPNPGHYALAELEQLGILKHLITQNVDNLHRAAGSDKVAEIHGNFSLYRCVKCNARFRLDEISLEVLPPKCPQCSGMIKTDAVMFGEPIPVDVLRVCQEETDQCDCMLSVGTSAFVYPAAGFPQIVKRVGGLLVEVDLHETPLTQISDISIRGRSGEILPELVGCVKSKMGKGVN
jgi:NAD-dependent deacetylase